MMALYKGFPDTEAQSLHAERVFWHLSIFLDYQFAFVGKQWRYSKTEREKKRPSEEFKKYTIQSLPITTNRMVSDYTEVIRLSGLLNKPLKPIAKEKAQKFILQRLTDWHVSHTSKQAELEIMLSMAMGEDPFDQQTWTRVGIARQYKNLMISCDVMPIPELLRYTDKDQQLVFATYMALVDLSALPTLFKALIVDQAMLFLRELTARKQP